jgi:hypothetical protein
MEQKESFETEMIVQGAVKTAYDGNGDLKIVVEKPWIHLCDDTNCGHKCFSKFGENLCSAENPAKPINVWEYWYEGVCPIFMWRKLESIT